MTNDRYAGADPLALAEAVAAGELTEVAAEAVLRTTHGGDTRAADTEVAEMRALLGAIRGVKRHATAFQQATDEARTPTERSAPFTVGSGAGPDPQTIEPRRVGRGNVRLRPARPVQRSRWAMPGILAAAAVVLVAVVVGAQLTRSQIAATPSPSSPVAIVSPSSPPSSSPSIAPTPTVVPTTTIGPTPSPAGTGIDGVPSIVSVPLAGAPGIAYWRLTAEDRITVSEWKPDGSAGKISFQVDTWPDQALADGIWIYRYVVASPDGAHIAFLEIDLQPPFRQRLRVFDGTGVQEWLDPNPVDASLAWSADGSRLAIGQQPGLWRIVTFGAGAPHVASFDLGGAYALLGFSRSGNSLYGYDSNGEAEFWGNPVTYPRAGGTVKPIGRFSGKSDPLATSNGTTPTTLVVPSHGETFQPGVDPKTGRVLDTGDLSGQLQGWEMRDGTTHAPIDFGTPGSSYVLGLAWRADGTVVVATSATADTPLDLHVVSPNAPTTPIGGQFRMPAGLYWQEFDGARGSTALLGLASDRAHDSLYLGADELVAVDLSTAQASVLVPDSPGLTGLHVAGWITAP